jgi:hypothetical protein
MLTSLYLTQTLAQAIADSARQQVGADVPDQLVPAGLRLLHSRPAAIILMTAPILYPIITNACFDRSGSASSSPSTWRSG